MRFRRMLGACSFAALAAACGDGAVASPDQGALVLEVGGDHSSLRQALQAAGVRLPADASAKRDDRGEDAAPAAPKPEPAPPPPRAVEDAFFTVELGEDQTLVQLARKHLGNGNRFREILELNGWTEADSRRLRVGQQVKIPRAAAGDPPRR